MRHGWEYGQMAIDLLMLIAGAYLLGSLPTAYIAGRLVAKTDLRRFGSGSVSASNLGEVAGRPMAILVGIADVAKGVIAVGAARELGWGSSHQVLAGLAAVVGHNWPIYLRFVGGRGLATSLGFLLALAPKELVGYTVVALALLASSRNVPVSLGMAMISTPLWSLGLQEPYTITSACAALAVILIAKRLVGSPGIKAEGLPWRVILLNRLIFDRDIRDRTAWLRQRRP